MSKSSRLNFVCVDDSEFSDNGFSWYLENYHRPTDTVGVVHVTEIPTLPLVSLAASGTIYPPRRSEFEEIVEETHKKAQGIFVNKHNQKPTNMENQR